MKTQTTQNDVQLQHNKLGDLETFTIHGDGYRAVVLRQGAQLIHFLTDCDADSNEPSNESSSDRISEPSSERIKEHSSEHSHIGSDSLQDTSTDTNYGDNWLWISEQAEFNAGDSVRGGVPICWPVFGQFAANPPAVQHSFAEVTNHSDMPQHGYARTQLFDLDSFSTSIDDQNNQTATLILRLDSHTLDNRFAGAPHMDLKVIFTFSADGFSIKTITQNNSAKTITFSQALHTYLPTEAIEATSIQGFDGVTFSDTLIPHSATGDWQTKTQQGDIVFHGEVDRIYHGAPHTTLHTPTQTYHLTAENSNSTVIWNPWVAKAKTISQFAADDYQRMLCIETANAHLDVVTLAAGEAWEMGVRIERQTV